MPVRDAQMALMLKCPALEINHFCTFLLMIFLFWLLFFPRQIRLCSFNSLQSTVSQALYSLRVKKKSDT